MTTVSGLLMWLTEAVNITSFILHSSFFIRQASPIHYINDSTALPSIFAYGEKDWLVRRDHYQSLQARFDSLGKPYDLIVFPNSGHMLMNDKDCTMRYDSTMRAYCKKYFGY
ncbi:MAG: dienelactone hydrolase family protein [Bacteroidaceae bacterium]|nr:dienelactone hydrolase family protein [Bacteroidaceae bacterium]